MDIKKLLDKDFLLEQYKKKTEQLRLQIGKLIKLKIITRYILQEFLPTFFICFFFFFIIFVINVILYNIRPLLEKSVPADLVFMMLLTSFPSILILSIPFGTMLATLMTMGRFSSDNEMVAFRAVGFDTSQVFGPIFIVGAALTLLTFGINDRLVPASIKEQRLTMMKIRDVKPTLNFKSKTVKKYEGLTVFTEEVRDTEIKGLIIMDPENQNRIISSPQASITSPEGINSVMELKMDRAMVQFENSDRPADFNYGYADSISYYIKFNEYNDGERKVSSQEQNIFEIYDQVKKYRKIFAEQLKEKNKEFLSYLYSTKEAEQRLIDGAVRSVSIAGLDNNFQRIDNSLSKMISMRQEKLTNISLNYNLIEFYRKFAFPLACIVFVIFAYPVGIYSKRAGYSIGFVVGLFLTAVYWFTFYGMFILGRKQILPPFIAMFFTDFLFLVIGVILLIKRLRE